MLAAFRQFTGIAAADILRTKDLRQGCRAWRALEMPDDTGQCFPANCPGY